MSSVSRASSFSTSSSFSTRASLSAASGTALASSGVVRATLPTVANAVQHKMPRTNARRSISAISVAPGRPRPDRLSAARRERSVDRQLTPHFTSWDRARKRVDRLARSSFAQPVDRPQSAALWSRTT
jgi:hypothetical protein